MRRGDRCRAARPFGHPGREGGDRPRQDLRRRPDHLGASSARIAWRRRPRAPLDPAGQRRVRARAQGARGAVPPAHRRLVRCGHHAPRTRRRARARGDRRRCRPARAHPDRAHRAARGPWGTRAGGRANDRRTGGHRCRRHVVAHASAARRQRSRLPRRLARLPPVSDRLGGRRARAVHLVRRRDPAGVLLDLPARRRWPEHRIRHPAGR